MIDPEQKRKSIETAVKLGVIAIGCAIVGPFAYLALEGMIAIAAFCCGALIFWGLAPSVATYVANKRIALLKAAVEANPIETMEQIQQEKTEELTIQQRAVEEVATQVRNVDGLVKGLEKTDPTEAKDYMEIRDKLQQGLDEVTSEYRDAETELQSFGRQIDKARRLWKVQTAVNKALDVSAQARASVFADIKKQVAFDTVTSNLNRAFARLDTAVQRRKSVGTGETPKALNPGVVQGEVIDLGAVHAGQRVIVNK